MGTQPDRLDVEHFTMRLLSDCLAEATRAYWLKRAEQLEAARPTPGDYYGNASREELSERWRRLTEMAEACRARAAVSAGERGGAISPDVTDVLREAS